MFVFGSVENSHIGVEIDARRIAKNVDVDVDILTSLTLLTLLTLLTIAIAMSMSML